jgi:hypothetical protein
LLPIRELLLLIISIFSHNIVKFKKLQEVSPKDQNSPQFNQILKEIRLILKSGKIEALNKRLDIKRRVKGLPPLS